jgi:hypothetical protein
MRILLGLGIPLLALADGAAAAATGLALITAVALALGRYAAGGAAQDSGHRRPVRPLGSRTPAPGGWQRIVADALADDSGARLRTVMRPQLQRLFAARLAERHGVAMYRNPQRARAPVGAELRPWSDPEATDRYRPAPSQPVRPTPRTRPCRRRRGPDPARELRCRGRPMSNRIKMLKRQMPGRAGFEPLRIPPPVALTACKKVSRSGPRREGESRRLLTTRYAPGVCCESAGRGPQRVAVSRHRPRGTGSVSGGSEH